MNWLKKIFNTNKSSGNPVPAIVGKAGIFSGIFIPEPTRSLLWVTNEDVSKIVSPGSVRITVTMDLDGVKSKIDDGHNFYGEPSLIWTKLSVEKNKDLEEGPMYYPAYSKLYPKNRFQYLSWLQDVTSPTNLSYVFLYFYGLERHLLVGKYEEAVSEILRLLKSHTKASFQSYAKQSLLVATLYHKRVDILESVAYISDGLTNEELLVRKYLGKDLTAQEVIALASEVGFKNKRYIKMYPERFKSLLDDKIKLFIETYGLIIDVVAVNDLKQDSTMAFANMSLPDKVRFVKVPQLLSDERFKSTLRTLLQTTHDLIKQR